MPTRFFILPADLRLPSADFSKWLEANFNLNCHEAGLITRRAQETYLFTPAKRQVARAERKRSAKRA